ncbi:MAG: aromatic acid exporter family protein [Tissierellia bacterium]|nr:aromatic acid exporter family protein [Tissierellia bacterium]
MRTAKTVLSVTLGLFISYLLKLRAPLFVAIAAMTTMQPTYYETFKSARLRLFTCIAGVMLGIILGLMEVPGYLKPLVAGLGTLGIMLFLIEFKLNRFVTLTVITFIASYYSSVDQWIYGWNRLVGTALGVFISLLVNLLIKKPHLGQDLHQHLERTYEEVFNISERLLLTPFDPDVHLLSDELAASKEAFSLWKKEVVQPFTSSPYSRAVPRLVECYDQAYTFIRIILTLPRENFHMSARNRARVSELFEYSELNPLPQGDTVDTVLNYHIESLLKLLREIQLLHDEVKGEII